MVGVVAATVLVLAGEDVRGSVLFGVGLAGVTATFAGVAGVTSQLVQVRRRAAGLAAGVLGVAYLLRMFGSSTDPRLWVRWTTPLGWVDVLDPYGNPDLRALLPLLAVPVALISVAVLLRARRDQGGALLAADADRPPRLRMLGSPLAFGWRSNLGVLLAWAVGLVAFGLVMGALVGTMVEWLAQDQDYQRMFRQMGLDAALSSLGFLAVLASMFGLAIAVQVAWRVGAARAEEESGRAEAVLAHPVSRLRWLGGHVALAATGGLLLALLSGSAVWVGCVASGLDEVTWWQAAGSVLNALPVVVLVGGLAVLTFGVLPRLTVAVPVAVSVVGYVLALLGPALSWPQWLLDLSPFTHLALVPADPWAAALRDRHGRSRAGRRNRRPACVPTPRHRRQLTAWPTRASRAGGCARFDQDSRSVTVRSRLASLLKAGMMPSPNLEGKSEHACQECQVRSPTASARRSAPR